jgi:hypothetical protein
MVFYVITEIVYGGGFISVLTLFRAESTVVGYTPKCKMTCLRGTQVCLPESLAVLSALWQKETADRWADGWFAGYILTCTVCCLPVATACCRFTSLDRFICIYCPFLSWTAELMNRNIRERFPHHQLPSLSGECSELSCPAQAIEVGLRPPCHFIPPTSNSRPTTVVPIVLGSTSRRKKRQRQSISDVQLEKQYLFAMCANVVDRSETPRELRVAMKSILSELQHLKFNFYWSSGSSMLLRSLPSTSCAVTVDT